MRHKVKTFMRAFTALEESADLRWTRRQKILKAIDSTRAGGLRQTVEFGPMESFPECVVAVALPEAACTQWFYGYIGFSPATASFTRYMLLVAVM